MRFFAVVPAAGRSLRMGAPKLLMPWRQSTIIEQVLGAWRLGGATATVVTVHPSDRELAERCRAAGAEVVVPPEAPLDMKASVRLALEFIQDRYRPEGRDAWLLAPADMPLLSSAAIATLIAEHRQAAEQGRPSEILAPIAQGRQGHPILFPWPLATEVSRLGAEEGVRALVDRHGARSNDVAETDDAELFQDVDTAADYCGCGATI